jgi:hypothetical protein
VIANANFEGGSSPASASSYFFLDKYELSILKSFLFSNFFSRALFFKLRKFFMVEVEHMTTPITTTKHIKEEMSFILK